MRKETILSFILATGVVAGGIWVADQSLKSKSTINAGQGREDGYTDSEVPNQPVAGIVGSVIGDAALGNRATNQGSTTATGISKCVVNEKIIYSNEGCPDGASGRTVAIHDSEGIVSPPKENLADLTAKRKTSERAYALQAQQQVASIGPSNATECAELNKRIESLDAMARQPQSGSMQDWIKDQRKAVRDRQFAIHC